MKDPATSSGPTSVYRSVKFQPPGIGNVFLLCFEIDIDRSDPENPHWKVVNPHLTTNAGATEIELVSHDANNKFLVSKPAGFPDQRPLSIAIMELARAKKAVEWRVIVHEMRPVEIFNDQAE